MITLPPQSFPFGKYEGQTIPYQVQTMSEKSYIEWLDTQLIVGYIKGMDLEIRPRTDSYGVLIEDEDGYETWAHVPNDIWEAFLKSTR